MSALEIPTTIPASDGGDFVLIEDDLLGADAANFDFTSIPGTYKALMVMGQLRGAAAAAIVTARLRLNNDSGSNYDWAEVYNGGSGAALGATEIQLIGNVAAASAATGYSASFKLLIPNYAGTAFFKQFSVENASQVAAVTVYVTSLAGGWRSTSAVSRITVFLSSGDILTGSRATLYGLN